jgi:hypothetical protein
VLATCIVYCFEAHKHVSDSTNWCLYCYCCEAHKHVSDSTANAMNQMDCMLLHRLPVIVTCIGNCFEAHKHISNSTNCCLYSYCCEAHKHVSDSNANAMNQMDCMLLHVIVTCIGNCFEAHKHISNSTNCCLYCYCCEAHKHLTANAMNQMDCMLLHRLQVIVTCIGNCFEAHKHVSLLIVACIATALRLTSMLGIRLPMH